MRRLLLALPFALLPLAMAHAADDHDHDHEHSSLAPHEHGVGSLNVALDGQTRCSNRRRKKAAPRASTITAISKPTMRLPAARRTL